MKASIICMIFSGAFALVIALSPMGSSAAPNPQARSGIDRLYVIDCGDGSGPDESCWT